MHIVTLLALCLPAADFAICDYTNHQIYPIPIHENNQYYVYWTDYRSTPIYTLYGARITEAGVVIDPNGKALFADSVFDPKVASDGSNMLVVWREGC